MKVLWFITGILFLIIPSSQSFGEKFDNVNDSTAEESLSDTEIVPSSYVLPEQIFNDGKPFYLEKDPVSGVLDFNSKKSSSIASIPSEIDPQTDKDISLNTNSIQPNFHDFLNLPVKYSSSKFVYPLVSSSYANLKYQGNNKNYISNHKNYSTTTTTSPKYYTKPSNGVFYEGEKKSSITVVTTSTTTTTTTTEIPSTTTATTTMSPSTTVNTSTPKPIYTRPPQKYTTTKYKYSTIRKRPLIISTTLTPAEFSARPTQNYDSPPSTTSRPITTVTKPSSTIMPKEPSTHSPFKPLPPAQPEFITKSPGEVYSSMSTKKDPDSMSLSDLFNSLLGDDDMSAESTTSLPPKPSSTTTEAGTVEIETRHPMFQNGSFEDVSSESNDSNDYVKFNVQKPNVNMIQFQPVPSMNNIIISPNKNSATFVLGSQQAVGTGGGGGVLVGTAEKEFPTQQNNNHLEQRPPGLSFPNQYQYGSIYNEVNMPALKPQGFTQQKQPQPQPSQSISNIGIDSMQKEAESVVRFPSNVNFDNAPVVTGTFSNDINLPNGHGAPIALPQNGNNLVVFPANSQSVETTVGAQHQAAGTDFMDNNSNLVSFSIDSANNFHQVPINNGDVVNTNPNAINNMHENGPLPPNPEPGLIPNNQQLPLANGVDQINYGQPQLSHGLTPPIDDHGRRPQFNDRNPIRQGPGRQPPFNRPEFTRKPLDGVHRPPTNNGDRPLPNILPQFRPNAKIAHSGGNNGPNMMPPNRGSLKYGFRQQQQQQPVSQQRIQQVESQMTRQRPPGIAPPHFRRGPPAANSFNAKMAPAASQPQPSSEQIDTNRRYYQIRQSIANDRVFGPLPHAPGAPNRRYIDGYPSKRNNDLGVLDNQPDTYLPIYQNNNEFTRNSSPLLTQPQNQQQPIAEQLIQNPPEDRIGKLEPVVTLQMLQHLKQLQKDSAGGVPSQPSPTQNINADAPVSIQTSSGNKPPVYVVYPVKTSPMKLDVIDDIGKYDTTNDPVVVGQRGEQPPLPPSEINSMSTAGMGTNGYQNTPFTVIRQEQKPILMAKNKHNKVQFPYALEKPTTLIKALAADKAASQQLKSSPPKYGFYDDSSETYNIGEGPAGETIVSRVVTGNMATYSGTHENGAEEDDGPISTKLTRLTDRPIAIAYTPTEPNHYYGPASNAQNQPMGDRFSSANHATSVIHEIRDENEDTDEFGNPSRGENYEQDFQAPFYPSVNLGNSIPDKRNSWAVVTPAVGASSSSTSSLAVAAALSSKEMINRSDKHMDMTHQLHGTITNSSENSSNEENTEHFDMNSFQPDFQGGFKPIYPPAVGGMKSNRPIDIAPKSAKLPNDDDSIEALVYEDLDNSESTTSS